MFLSCSTWHRGTLKRPLHDARLGGSFIPSLPQYSKQWRGLVSVFLDLAGRHLLMGRREEVAREGLVFARSSSRYNLSRFNLDLSPRFDRKGRHNRQHISVVDFHISIRRHEFALSTLVEAECRKRWSQVLAVLTGHIILRFVSDGLRGCSHASHVRWWCVYTLQSSLRA